MSGSYRISRQGQIVGPFSRQQIEQMLTNGLLGSNDKLSRDGETWHTCRDLTPHTTSGAGDPTEQYCGHREGKAMTPRTEPLSGAARGPRRRKAIHLMIMLLIVATASIAGVYLLTSRGGANGGQAYARQAQEAWVAGDNAKAELLAGTALDRDPSCIAALLLMAQISSQRGDYDRAIHFADRTIAVRPSLSSPWNMKASILLDQGKLQEGLSMVNTGLSHVPGSAPLWVVKATALMDLGNLTEALEACDRAIHLARKHLPAVTTKGFILLELGRHQEAITCFRRVVTSRPLDQVPQNAWLDVVRPAWLGMAYAHAALGQRQDGARCAQQARALGAEVPSDLQQLLKGP